MVFSRCIKSLKESRMAIQKEPILKFSPSWLSSKLTSCNGITQKSYTLKFQANSLPTKAIISENHQNKEGKLYMMYTTFFLNGNYMLCVQRRTTDFRKSTFQVVIFCTQQIQHEINKFEGKRGDITVPLQTCEKVFDINFTEIHQVEFHAPHTLTIVGVNNSEDYLFRQYRVKATKYDFDLKEEFSLSPSARTLTIKNKKTIGTLKDLCIDNGSQFVLTSAYSENHITCFVYSISSFSCGNRWLICVYDSKATRLDEKFKYLEIRENLIRGRVTGVSLLNQQSRIVLVTNTSQILMYDIQKKRIALKYNRLLSEKTILLESEEEFLFTQKVIQPMDSECDYERELLLICSKSGMLYSVPGSYNPAQTSIQSIDISSCIQNDDHLYIEQFLVCNFTKQCFLLCRSGLIYNYDIKKHCVTQTFGIHDNNNMTTTVADDFNFMDLPTFYYNLISVNQFGNEVYYLRDNALSVYLARDTDCETLQESCRKVLLQSFPKRYLKNCKMPTKVKNFIFSGV